jgi:fatty acid desaturase
VTGAFTVALRYEDYLAANWLVLRRRWIWRGSLRYLAIITALLSVITLSDMKNPLSDPYTWVSAIITSIVLAFIFLAAQWGAFRVLTPRSARKSWAQLHLDGLPTLHEFDDNGIVINNDRATSNFTWSMLSAWIEDDRLLLMFRTRLMFHAVPKDQVAPAELEKLRAALAAAAVPTKC